MRNFVREIVLVRDPIIDPAAEKEYKNDVADWAVKIVGASKAVVVTKQVRLDEGDEEEPALPRYVLRANFATEEQAEQFMVALEQFSTR